MSREEVIPPGFLYPAVIKIDFYKDNGIIKM